MPIRIVFEALEHYGDPVLRENEVPEVIRRPTYLKRSSSFAFIISCRLNLEVDQLLELRT